MIVILVSLSLKKPEEPVINIETQYTEFELDWSTVYDIKVQGEEGNTTTELEFKGVPSLEERIEEGLEFLNEEKKNKATIGEDVTAISNKINELTLLKDKNDFCKLNESYDALKNGDTITVVCSGEALDEFDYKTNNGFAKSINGLLPATVVVEEATPPATYDDPKYSNLRDDWVDREEDKYLTTASGDYAYVYAKDLKNFNLDEKYKNTKYVIIEISSDDEYDDALAITNRYSNVVAIKNGTKAWTINSNFKEAVGWLGVSD